MSNFDTLKPSEIWHYFEQILQIPRPSKHEEKIRNFLIDFALEHKLSYKTDSAGNLLISKAASPGFENRKTVILQSHMDMVGEKNSDSDHNFFEDEIRAKKDGEWVKAENTTLGADD